MGSGMNREQSHLWGPGQWAGVLALSCALGFIFTFSFRSLLGASGKASLASDFVTRTWLQFFKSRLFCLWEFLHIPCQCFPCLAPLTGVLVQAAHSGPQNWTPLPSVLLSPRTRCLPSVPRCLWWPRDLSDTSCASPIPGLGNLSVLSATSLAILESHNFCLFCHPVVLAGLLRSGFDLIFSRNHSLPFLFLTCGSEIRPWIE